MLRWCCGVWWVGVVTVVCLGIEWYVRPWWGVRRRAGNG